MGVDWKMDLEGSCEVEKLADRNIATLEAPTSIFFVAFNTKNSLELRFATHHQISF